MVITCQYLIHPNCLIWLGKLHVIKYCWTVISNMRIVLKDKWIRTFVTMCTAHILCMCIVIFFGIFSICICTISLLYHEYEINISLLLLIGERARFCAVGALGRNWARRAMAMIAAPPCADSLASTPVIRELLDIRDGVTSMPDFSNDEITLLIDYMCCSWVKRRTPVNLVSVGSFNL